MGTGIRLEPLEAPSNLLGPGTADSNVIPLWVKRDCASHYNMVRAEYEPRRRHAFIKVYLRGQMDDVCAK